jgi:hypothetical protein
MYNRHARTIVVGFVLILVAYCAVTTGSADVATATSVRSAQPVSVQAHAPTGPNQAGNPLSGSDASIVEFSLGIGVLFTGIALFGLRAYRRQPGGYYVHPFRGR